MKEIFEKLHRPINPAGYITEIDGFRFFAIFTVCLLHLNNFFAEVSDMIITKESKISIHGVGSLIDVV